MPADISPTNASTFAHKAGRQGQHDSVCVPAPQTCAQLTSWADPDQSARAHHRALPASRLWLVPRPATSPACALPAGASTVSRRLLQLLARSELRRDDCKQQLAHKGRSATACVPGCSRPHLARLLEGGLERLGLLGTLGCRILLRLLLHQRAPAAACTLSFSSACLTAQSQHSKNSRSAVVPGR